jgi:hypothetical protein
VIRVFAAACAVGLIALTLTLGSLRHPSTAISPLPEPPVSHPVVPPVAIAPPAAVPPAAPRHPKRRTRVHVAAHPHRVAPKIAVVRPTVIIRPTATTPSGPKRSIPHPKERRPTPKPPPAKPSSPPVAPPTTPPAAPLRPTTTTTPVASPPAPTPPVTTVPAPPPVVTVPSETTSRPGNGKGDPNHAHTGPPGHSKR